MSPERVNSPISTEDGEEEEKKNDVNTRVVNGRVQLNVVHIKEF